MQLPDVSSGFINCYGCQRLYHVSCSHQIGLYDEYLRFTCGCQSVVEATQYIVDDGFQTRKLGLDCQSDDSNEALEEANKIIAEHENPPSPVDPVGEVGPDTRKSYYFDYCPVGPVGPIGPVQEEARHSSMPSVSYQPTLMTSSNPRDYGVKRPAGANRIIAENENPSSPVGPVVPDTRKLYYFSYSPICPVGPVQEETFEARHSLMPSVRHQPTPVTSSNPRNYGVKRPAGSELMSEKVKSIRLSTNPGDKENTCPIATTTMILVPRPSQTRGFQFQA